MSALPGATSSCANNGSDAGDMDKGIMLFGVRLTEGTGSSFRKCASMNNLAQLDNQPQDNNLDVNTGYASDDVVHLSARGRERKRGVPWTEEEHKLFLIGLEKVGKGDWRGISRNFVKTRTPTQVASHAQKYFLRRNNHSRRRRRSSLFDITADTHINSAGPAAPPCSNNIAFPVAIVPAPVSIENPMVAIGVSPVSIENPMDSTLALGLPSTKQAKGPLNLHLPPTSKMADLKLNSIDDELHLSLKLSVSPASSYSLEQQSPPLSPTRDASAFHGISSGFNNSDGDSIISVA